MTEHPAEIRKQFVTYADAITAFASAQCVAYVFLLTHGDCFTLNVITSIGWSAGLGALANAVYIVLIRRCMKTAGLPLGGIQGVRFLIIFAEMILTVVIPFGIRSGYQAVPQQFFIACKACAK